MDLSDVGKQIRQARLSQGLTMKEVLRRSSLSSPTWYAIEEGRYNVLWGNVAKALEAVGLDWETVIGRQHEHLLVGRDVTDADREAIRLFADFVEARRRATVVIERHRHRRTDRERGLRMSVRPQM